MSEQDIFKNYKEILITQEFAAMGLCGCEASRHRISKPVNGDEEGTDTFLYIDEESGCLERICCKQNRSLKLQVHQGASQSGPVIQTMEKPFHLNATPTFTVLRNEGPQKVGTVQYPFRGCAIDQQVLDKSDEVIFTTHGSICQLGLYCPCCGPAEFDINRNDKKVGSFSRPTMTCGEMGKMTSRVLVDFDQITDPMERRMVLAAAMLADLQYFRAERESSD